MMFNTRHVALAALATSFVSALPLDISSPRDILPRAKSYSVINVDGGASTRAPADVTTIVDHTTKTVQVIDPGTTVTATIVEPVPAPAVTSTSTSCTSTSSRASTPTPTSTKIISSTTTSTSSIVSTAETAKPVFVTVTVTDDAGPTEYYDSGMWHTSYRIKSFEAVATPLVFSTPSVVALSSTAVPAW